ncbi:hypothetical protein IA69_05660 [Massilia sp. JS1662]|nr:hypothetical protein [Massilia sp. JS1662]KGF82753.1 hypothetical protein IA69_05660 [Massilia sp. JS1662]
MLSATVRLSVMAMLAAGLVACTPVPHVAHMRPAVEGIVLEEGKPVAGAQLFLGKFPGNSQPCTDVGEVIPVTADGRFSWMAVDEHRRTTSLLNPPAASGTLTVLCIRHPAKGSLIGAVLFVMQNESVALRLRCDLARPRASGGAHTVSAMLGQPHYCEASDAG